MPPPTNTSGNSGRSKPTVLEKENIPAYLRNKGVEKAIVAPSGLVGGGADESIKTLISNGGVFNASKSFTNNTNNTNISSSPLAKNGKNTATAASMRGDATFEDQVKEYNARRAQLSRHKALVQKLKAEREASMSPTKEQRGQANHDHAAHHEDVSARKNEEHDVNAAKKTAEEGANAVGNSGSNTHEGESAVVTRTSTAVSLFGGGGKDNESTIFTREEEDVAAVNNSAAANKSNRRCSKNVDSSLMAEDEEEADVCLSPHPRQIASDVLANSSNAPPLSPAQQAAESCGRCLSSPALSPAPSRRGGCGEVGGKQQEQQHPIARPSSSSSPLRGGGGAAAGGGSMLYDFSTNRFYEAETEDELAAAVSAAKQAALELHLEKQRLLANSNNNDDNGDAAKARLGGGTEIYRGDNISATTAPSSKPPISGTINIKRRVSAAMESEASIHIYSMSMSKSTEFIESNGFAAGLVGANASNNNTLAENNDPTAIGEADGHCAIVTRKVSSSDNTNASSSASLHSSLHNPAMTAMGATARAADQQGPFWEGDSRSGANGDEDAANTTAANTTASTPDFCLVGNSNNASREIVVCDDVHAAEEEAQKDNASSDNADSVASAAAADEQEASSLAAKKYLHALFMAHLTVRGLIKGTPVEEEED